MISYQIKGILKIEQKHFVLWLIKRFYFYLGHPVDSSDRCSNEFIKHFYFSNRSWEDVELECSIETNCGPSLTEKSWRISLSANWTQQHPMGSTKVSVYCHVYSTKILIELFLILFLSSFIYSNNDILVKFSLFSSAYFTFIKLWLLFRPALVRYLFFLLYL